MKTRDKFKSIGIAVLLVVGFSACDRSGTAENAGRKIDQAVDSAGKNIDRSVDAAGRKMSEAANRANEKIDEQGAKAGVAMNDAEITGKVKAAIFAEPGLQTLQISVDTVGGVVTLSGSVDSAPSSDRATGLARAVAGVSRVENRLMVKSSG